MPEIKNREDKSASENAKALKKKQVQRPRTRNTENVAYENRSDPCGCWCAWYSEEGYGRKHQESIRESYYDRDSKD